MLSYLAIAMLAFGATADPQPVEWQENYGESRSKPPAQRSCCWSSSTNRKRKPREFSQPARRQGRRKGSQALKHYRLVHIDASTKYGQKVAGAFRAKRFPHMAIIDKSGKVVLFKKSGKISSSD